MSRSLAVFTPWYPSLGNPVLGTFVADWSRLAAGGFDVRVVNTVEWPGGSQEVVDAHGASFAGLIGRMGAAGHLDAQGDFGTVTRVPHALVGGWTVPRRSRSAVEAVAASLPELTADVMHGHVAYFGGLAAARAADPNTRVVVTEHSTETGNVLADPAGRELYCEVLERASSLTCVSTYVRDLILSHLPAFSEKVVVVPNPVDFESVPRRSATAESLDRWVFIGGLIERKGVERLLSAFVRFAAGRPGATLDLYGEGHLRSRLEDGVRLAGLGGRVTFHGNVPKAEVLAALPEFDVLVAPSVYETFHLAVCEAVGAGLPVVVTRSGGPEEALGETIGLCGRFIDVAEDPGDILDAVADLERHTQSLDMESARVQLSARFGPDSVRRRLAELYGVEPWTAAPRLPRQNRAQPDRVEVFARRTWRSPAVEPQIALARAHGAAVNLIGVPQPKAARRPLTVPQRAVRKARRLLTGLIPATPMAAGAGTVALLGDVTSAADVDAFWSANPAIRPSVELDPTLFGAAPVDATGA